MLLKKHAYDNNKITKKNRNGKEWYKSGLSNIELLYLYQSGRGRCCNKKCQCSLDSSFAVEHIKPKSKYPELTWDIRNMTILCTSCNSRKNDKAPKDVDNFMYDAMPSVIADNEPLKRWCNNGRVRR
jgi:5-methylcytosine-specific restriction endonuclease McrA